MLKSIFGQESRKQRTFRAMNFEFFFWFWWILNYESWSEAMVWNVPWESLKLWNDSVQTRELFLESRWKWTIYLGRWWQTMFLMNFIIVFSRSACSSARNQIDTIKSVWSSALLPLPGIAGSRLPFCSLKTGGKNHICPLIDRIKVWNSELWTPCLCSSKVN